MEKAAQRKSYRDPALNKIVQEKARWNREVSSLINDIIHLKKSMNGWPSKYYKERTRITQPAPIDLSGILGGLATKFQDLANEGNGIIQEQSEFARSRVKRQSEKAQSKLEEKYGPTEGLATTPAPAAPKPDLTQQMQKGLAASEKDSPLVKLAIALEDKYELEAIASNPVTRFVARLFNPKFGFGEAARMRRLRMTMLDACVKSYKELKKLHKEIVKSNKSSIDTSHKIMTAVSNHWNVVYRLMSTYKAIRPTTVVTEQGGPLEDEELKKEKAMEEGRDPDAEQGQPEPADQERAKSLLQLAQDYRKWGSRVPAKGAAFRELNNIVERVVLAPQDQKVQALLSSNIEDVYRRAIGETNTELGTRGSSFEEIHNTMNTPVNRTAQRQLGKLRHQLIPGATSGQRLEIYRFIEQIKKDLNEVMDLLEKGFDQEKLTTSITKVHREMTALRTMVRSLYASEKPDQPMPFF